MPETNSHSVTNGAEKSDGNFEFDFREWPFYWLARADRTYHVILERLLAHISLDIPSWRVLMILHVEGSASVSEIADHAIVKLPTMTKIIQRMQTDGLVTCAPSAKDRRVTIVTITEAGEKAGREAWKESAKIKERVFDNFSAAEQRSIVSVLQKLSNALTRY
jgi:DNA-binding MarR family transcriptional regulator